MDSVKDIAQKFYYDLQSASKRLALLSRITGETKRTGSDTDGLLYEKDEQLALANALSRIVLSSSDLDDLCEGFANELRKLISIDWAAIGLIDKFTDVIRLSPLSVRISSTWELGDNIPIASTPLEWLANNKQAMLETDLKTESRFRTGTALLRQGLRAVVYMPLFSRKEVFGGLIIGSKRPNAYGERELKLLKYAVTQLAIAIENSRLFKESREGLKREADFINTITHELKTPLTPIRASGALLAEELQQDMENPQAKLAENILRSAHVLDNRLSAMLELAKVQSSALELHIESIDIKPALEAVAAQLEPDIRSKEQSLNLEIPSSLPPVKADNNQLKRIVFNLLTNAALLTPPCGSIDVSVKKQENEIVVSVKDSGEGLSPEEQKYLFEAYHTSEADRQRPLELRLRLAVCKHLVEMHRGRIWVESNAGKGSTFAFSIPLN